MILSHLFRKIRFDAQTKGEGRAVVVVVVVNAICVCDAPHHRLICDANGKGPRPQSTVVCRSASIICVRVEISSRNRPNKPNGVGRTSHMFLFFSLRLDFA